MADGFTVKLEGIDELKRRLNDASKTIRVKAVRGALRKAGQIISKAAKVAAPVLSVPTKTRKPGTVKKAIAVRNSKFARQAGNEGVFIGVRPLRGARQNKLGKAGANNPNDPYYWRFIEFDTKPHLIKAKNKKCLYFNGKFVKSVNHPGTKGKRFLTQAADSKGEEAIKTFMDSVIPQIEKLNAKGAA